MFDNFKMKFAIIISFADEKKTKHASAPQNTHSLVRAQQVLLSSPNYMNITRDASISSETTH
jgi:hypothetical protein